MTRFQRIMATFVVCVATLLCLLTLGASRASADLFTSELNIGNDAISGFTGPFGTVTVDLTTFDSAEITVASNTVGGNIYLFGSVNAVDVDVNASSFSILGIDGFNAGTGFTPGPFTSGGSGNVDGLGTFNATINSFDGFTHSSDSVTITLLNNGGTWTSAADVLTPNADGNDAAAHIFVTSSPANASNGAIVTGFAGEGPSVPVPEPSSLALLLTGLVGFAGIVGTRRRKLPA